MYKATRTLITERQKFCKAELMVVSVKKTPTGKLNDCTNNALDATEEGDEVRTVTGWLVHPYDAITVKNTDSTKKMALDNHIRLANWDNPTDHAKLISSKNYIFQIIKTIISTYHTDMMQS